MAITHKTMKILFHTTEEFLHSKKTKQVDKFNPNICLTFLFLGNSTLAFLPRYNHTKFCR